VIKEEAYVSFHLLYSFNLRELFNRKFASSMLRYYARVSKRARSH